MARPKSTGYLASADPKVVEAWAADLTDAYIMCRDMGHTWRPFKAKYVSAENAYERVLRCGRCKTERVQMLDTSGAILTGHYDYPEGYQAPAGTGRIDGEGRGYLRLESTLRIIGKDEKD